MTDYLKNFVTDFGAPTDGTTPCNSAFVAWQTFLAGLSAGDSVGLTIPDAAHGGASTYILAAGLDHTSFAPGILGGITININCQNVNLDGDFFLGNIDGETGLYALAQTISPGATSAVVSDTSIFTVLGWVVITGINIQSGGDPPNNRLLEFRQITAINSGTSTISWSGPVVNTYKSTWPFYSHLAPFGGGPATINTLPTYNPTRTSGFDAVVTYNNTGGTIKCNGGANQLYPKVRQITMIGGTMTNFSPTQSQSIALVGCNMGANVMEQDKFVGTFTSTGCTYPGAVACQSGTGEYSFTGDTVNGAFNGTPGKLTLNNCVLNDQFQFGPSGYGFTEEVHFINTAFNGAIQQNILGDLVSAWDWQGGGIFRTNDPTPGDTLKPLLWIGGYFYYQGTGGRAYGHTFQVTDAWQSGGFTYVQTTLPVIPTFDMGSSGFSQPDTYRRIEVNRIYASGVTGGLSFLSNAPQGRPFYEYNETQISGVQNGGTPSTMIVYGTIVKIEIDVVQAVVGVSPCHMLVDQFGAFIMDPTDTIIRTGNFNFVDATVTGLRTIFPTTVSGSVGADSLAPMAGWLMGDLAPMINVSTAGASVQPIINIRVFLDQGIISQTANVVLMGQSWT